MKTISVKIKFTITLSDQDIDDLMVTALEGGINYWCGKVKIIDSAGEDNILASDVISKGGSLRLYDAESSDSWILSLESFMNGVKFVCESLGYKSAEELMDNHDADTADCIIQYALFNEIVFG